VIFDRIQVHNFGVFQGIQQALLTPKSPHQPIVLFGGLNGSGKTTLLEAFYLSLYGKLSPSFRNENGSYEKYLKRSIHHGASKSDGASVELTFRVIAAGKEEKYRICRSWTVKEDRMREYFDVFLNEQPDPALADTWAEQVDRFIPTRLASLFLFDGERIEALADPEKSAEVLKTAIHGLLGLDLIDRLNTDLHILERRKRKSLRPAAEQETIERTENEIRSLEDILLREKQNRAALQNQAERAQKAFFDIDNKYALEGGQIFEAVQQVERARVELEGKRDVIREELRNLAAGSLPLTLVDGLLKSIQNQSKRESLAFSSKILLSSIRSRDTRILSELRRQKVPTRAVKKVRDYLERDRKGLDQKSKIIGYLKLDPRVEQNVSGLLTNGLNEQQEKASRLLNELNRLETNIDILERKAAAVPDKESIAVLMKKRQEALEQVRKREAELQEADFKINEIERRKTLISGKLETCYRTGKTVEIENRDVERFLRHSSRVRSTMDTYRERLLRQHANRLEQLILEGYSQLLRKRSLVAGIRIDPSSYTLNLSDASGRLVSPERLSAGERQLLAVSILWGLARASGRPLPVAIDTPLGRLDASHRTFLVDRYFPFASHQVMLFSTDEEIHPKYFNRLIPWIGHSYRLEHRDETSSSSIEKGYFW